MRASLVGLAGAALALTLLPSSPALAARTTVDGKHLSAAGVRVITQSCADNDRTLKRKKPQLRIVRDRTSPLGQGAIGWTTRKSGFETGPLVRLKSPSTLSKLQISVVRRGATLSGHAVARYVPAGDPGQWRGKAVVPNLGPKGWRRVDATDLSFVWRHYDADGRRDQIGPNGTIKQFALDHGGDGQGAWVGFAFGCNRDKFDVDALRVKSSGQNKTVDFEPYSATATLTAGRKKLTTLIAGATLKLKASVKDGSGHGIRSRAVVLRADRGSKRYRPLTKVRIGKSGTTTVRLRPQVGSSYKLLYRGTKTRVASTSQPVSVAVHTNVRARLVRNNVITGNPFTVSGRFWPGRAMPLLLQKYSNKKWSTERRLRSAKDGTFRVSMGTGRIGKSYWRIYVPKHPGSLDGRSPAMRLITSPKPRSGGGGTTPTNPTPPPTEPTQPPPPPTGPQ